MTDHPAVTRAAAIWKWMLGILAAGLITFVAILVIKGLMGPEEQASRPSDGSAQPVPVEVAAVTQGPIELRRVFSGSLESPARTTIASKVAGRILTVPLDLSDTVERGAIVATLEPEEFAQVVTQGEADLAVAEARLREARSIADNTQREFDRLEQLHADAVVSDSELDAARSAALADAAAVAVAEAQVARARSVLAAAKLRLGYTTIRADWSTGDASRVVAERFAEEGETISEGSPIVSIIELDPILAVMFVSERDYAMLAPGQEISLQTDAYPGRAWSGRISRIAPIFREGSRQARVEVAISNPDASLRPGMFVRVAAVLDRVESATIAPDAAITSRDGRTVVFSLNDAEDTVRMVPVQIGIRDGDRVQIVQGDVGSRVVTLGQQLLGDGSAVHVVGPVGTIGSADEEWGG